MDKEPEEPKSSGPEASGGSEPAANHSAEGESGAGAADPTQEVTTGSKLPPNVAAGLAEVFPLAGGIVFYVLDKDTPIVRFHALQSIYFGVALVVLNIFLGILSAVGVFGIPILGGILGCGAWLVITVGALVLWVMGMVKAFGGERWPMPVIGPMVESQIGEGA